MLKERDRSDDSHAVLDEDSRQIKAQKIIKVLKTETGLKNKTLLDIGTGSGYMAQGFGEATKKTVSIDVVDERRVKKGYEFKKVKDETLPFDDGSFDIVISNHVIEHVQDQKLHVDEMIRVLKPGGLIYMATPNKYWLIDPHYRIPFINWMPRSMATSYLKLLQNNEWDIAPVSRSNIKSLVAGRGTIDSKTFEIVKNPEKYNLDTFSSLHSVIQKSPDFAVKMLDTVIPTLILIIKKNN